MSHLFPSRIDGFPLCPTLRGHVLDIHDLAPDLGPAVRLEHLTLVLREVPLVLGLRLGLLHRVLELLTD